MQRTEWLWLLLGPAAGWWWSGGRTLPRVECLSFTIALMFVGLAGVLTQDLMDGSGKAPETEPDRPRAGIFQILWLGQYAIFALALAITPLAALLTDRTGWKIPFYVSLPIVLSALAYYRLRGGEVWRRSGPAPHTIPMAALLGIALFRGLYLHSTHGGAIGHDTQQHIFWAEHISDYGFLPFTSRDSDLLLSYPRFFHLLAAGWNALGMFGPIGPYIKVMPILQTLLACGFFCELILSGRTPNDTNQRTMAPVLFGTFLCWHLTLGDGQSVYPLGDLSGTPRLASGWLLFGLPLLVLAERIGTFRDARTWIVAFAPGATVAAIGINPVVLAFIIFYAIPLAFAWYALSLGRKHDSPLRLRSAMPGVVAGTFVALVANPFVAVRLLGMGWVRALLHWAGVRTTSAGLTGTTWAVPGIGESGLCPKGWAACAPEIAKQGFQHALDSLWSTLSAGSLPGIKATPQVWYWIAFAAPLAVLAVHSLRSARPIVIAPRQARVFLAILIGSIPPALGILFCSDVLKQLEVIGPAWGMFAWYFAPHWMFLSTWMLCVLAASSWVLAPPVLMGRRSFAALLALAAALIAHELSSFAPPELVNHRNAIEGWKINWPELRAIKHLNEFVPENEAILMVALHVGGNEQLLFVNSSMGVILPHLETRVLFGLSLGSGLDYGWPDLETNFCQATPETRNAFLRRSNARWVLVRGEPISREAFRSFRWPCGVALTDLSAEYPPAWHERDLTLYRINP